MLRAAGCAPVIVVTGAVTVEVLGALTVPNADWQSGMGSSFRAGLGALPAACPAAVIALVDQPLITAEAVHRLIEAYESGARVVVATYGGEPRNPVLLGAEHFADAAAQAEGDLGARAFLRSHPELITPVPCDDVAAPDDIDTPDDMKQLS